MTVDTRCEHRPQHDPQNHQKQYALEHLADCDEKLVRSSEIAHDRLTTIPYGLLSGGSLPGRTSLSTIWGVALA